MVLRLLESAAGLYLAGLTLRDVCETVVVPGGSRGSLKLVRRLARGTLPVWKHVRDGPIGVNFAPAIMLGAFVGWMMLLVLAFGLMLDGLGDAFSPPLEGFGAALYAAGSALATIGVGNGEAHGAARVVLVFDGLCGLSVMTMAVTYLLEVQSNIAHRDNGVLKITTTSGHPPSALGLLERYAALEIRDDLPDVLRNGRDWCAGVLQSHASHPSLIYFRSVGTGSGWPATLGTMVDLCLIIEHLLDAPQLRGLAVLLREQAARLAKEVTTLLSLAPAQASPMRSEVDALCERLRAAGYALREAADLDGFIAARGGDVGCIDALSHHLGSKPAPLLAA
ncbi:hypothetical protein [Ramlibacter sp.]|uniref:hypothetical protein n=1 Tax=Ramlibacter sp. TaxID=1917967 RepID=UPI002621A01D|nr:hypothetical protein [Ramlibacter sp.]MDB5954217.1 hypothetical protein [Ramlibacter sp.]